MGEFLVIIWELKAGAMLEIQGSEGDRFDSYRTRHSCNDLRKITGIGNLPNITLGIPVLNSAPFLLECPDLRFRPRDCLPSKGKSMG
jgi:hypothetical protein